MKSRSLGPRVGPSSAPPAQTARSFKPTVEMLEVRLVMSSDAITPTPTDISHEVWDQLTFNLDDAGISDYEFAADAGSLSMEGIDLIGGTQVHSQYGYTGTGYTVAIIDTGIDYNHPALGGGWGNRVIGGWDFANNDADPMDDNGHGTHVAGIVGSSDANYTGVAPNVNFVALKVIGADGTGTFGNIELALQWVVAHQSEYNIVAINMSLGSGNYSADPFQFLDDEFAALESEDVFIAVAAGNSYYSYSSQQGLAYPAVSNDVVSVGAVWAGDFGSVTWMSGARDYTTGADFITSFTQRSSSLDLLAPGAMITSTYLGGGFKSMAGTSMATPMVAGAAAVLHQALEATGHQDLANQAGILNILQSTGVTVIDGDNENDNVINTGLSFKRIDLLAALQSIQQSVNHPPTLGSIASQTVEAGSSVAINLNGSDADGDNLTYTAQVRNTAGSSSTASTTSSTAALAYELKEKLGLTFGGSYFTGVWGQNEKWLLGTGTQWYCLMPNGDLRRWAGSMTATLTSNYLVASLGVDYYNDPSLLWNAQPPSQDPGSGDGGSGNGDTGNESSIAVTVVGNQLIINAPAGASGTYTVDVTVSDGNKTATQSFEVTVAAPVANHAPTLGTISDVVLAAGKNTTTITIPASDADGDSLTFTADLTGVSKTALEVKQTYNLRSLGSYFQNLLGKGEKWFVGNNSQFYVLQPDGSLNRWAGSIPATFSDANLIAKLDSTYYADPNKLYNAVQPTFSFADNKLTISTPSGYTGSFSVKVSVSDGQAQATETFKVSIGTGASGLRSLDEATVPAFGTAAPGASIAPFVVGLIEVPRSEAPVQHRDTSSRDVYFQQFAESHQASNSTDADDDLYSAAWTDTHDTQVSQTQQDFEEDTSELLDS